MNPRQVGITVDCDDAARLAEFWEHVLGYARRPSAPGSPYVTIERAGLTPWKNALISLAGPVVGGVAAAVVWGVGSARGSTMLEVLGNMGFLLNAFNMLPIGFLDGGQTVRAAREAWRMPVIRFEAGVPVQAFAPDRTRAGLIVCFYVTVAALLVLGMLASRVNGAL